MQELIIPGIIFTIANLLLSVWGYKLKNYKTAIFNAFCAGVCFHILLDAISSI